MTSWRPPPSSEHLENTSNWPLPRNQHIAPMRSTLKWVAEQVLGTAAWLSRPASVRQGRLILAYHNVRPPNEAPVGERALHIPWSRFLEHLDLITSHADIVPLSDIFGPPPKRSRFRVALTFDDAYSGAVELALPEVARRGMSATMFVAPGLLDGRSFWWDQMAEPYGGSLPGEARHHALTTLGGQQEKVESWAAEAGAKWATSMPNWATGASTAALLRAAELPGISLGAHSWSHPNLIALTADELDHELTAPRQWLQEHKTPGGEWLAYPYGLADSSTEAAASRGGYHGALMVSGGFLSEHIPQYQVPRLNVPAGLSQAGLKLRLAGRLTA